MTAPSRRLARSALARTALLVVVLIATICVPLANPNGFWLQLIDFTLVYSILAIGVNISFGWINSLPFSQVAFFGLGAYASGILFKHTDSFWLALLVSIALALVGALVLGVVTAHLSGFQFAIVTLAIAGLFQLAVTHWTFTGSSTGVVLFSDIRLSLGFASWTLLPKQVFVLTAVVFGVLLLAADTVLRTRVGSILRSARDHRGFSESLGYSPDALRLGAFVVTSVLGAIAGCLYYCFQGIAAPTSFDQQTALLLALMAVIGGKDFFWAPAIGAAAFEILPQEAGIGQDYVWLIAGGLMIVCVVALPKGVVGAGARLTDRFVPSRTTPPPGLELEVVTRAREAVRHAASRPVEKNLLRVEEVTRRFGGLTALDQVSVTVDGGGEVVGIIGTNGSGKTTLFNVISGQLTPQSGRVIFDGYNITGVRPQRIARTGLVRTFQEGAVFPELTVEESFEVAGLGTLASSPSALVRASLRGALSRQWLERDVRVGNLSYGTQRLLMIGAAFATAPKLVLLDEPAAGLGAQEGRWVVGMIREAAARGISVMLIEHHMDLVSEACDRLVVLGDGKVITAGVGDKVMSDERVVDSLLGRFGREMLDQASTAGAGGHDA